MKSIFLKAVLGGFLFLLISPGLVGGATATIMSGPSAACPGPPGQTPTQWFNCIIDRIIDNLVFPVFAGLIIIMTIVAGILFVTARGKEDQINTAKKMMIWVTVGIVVGLIAFSVEGIVRSLLGLA